MQIPAEIQPASPAVSLSQIDDNNSNDRTASSKPSGSPDLSGYKLIRRNGAVVNFEPNKIAVALSKAFNIGVNELPLSMILSWYEQKAVAILLTLLYLGIKDIRLGPSLPAFITPNVLDVLVKNFNIMPISTPDADLKAILG